MVQSSVSLHALDQQLLGVRASTAELPTLDDLQWRSLATTIHGEAHTLSQSQRGRLGVDIAIPVARYIEEMVAFQLWMDLASTLGPKEPAVVRAQVMTQLYVSFVWLRDSLLEPVSTMLPGSATKVVVDFLSSGRRRHLRNAVAHGRWTYLDDFRGLEAWDKDGARNLTKEIITSAELGAWQTLARGTSIAVLLSLDDGITASA